MHETQQHESPPSMAARAVHRPLVTAHEQVAERTWRIRLACPALAAASLPGQFVMLRLPGRDDPLLARPLAVFDTHGPDGRPCGGPQAETLDLLYLVQGRFTRALAGVAAGCELLAWGPLGNGYDPPPVDHLVLVAGGIGQTALLMLGRERLGGASYGLVPRAAPRAKRVSMAWGARHAGLFAGIEEFRGAGIDVRTATIDGSHGTTGTVVDLLDDMLGPQLSGGADTTRIACCGPEAMMAAVSRWAAGHHIGCDVSLETPMACGVGICFTCVAPIRDGQGGWDYRRTCVEGPVFDAADVVWET